MTDFFERPRNAPDTPDFWALSDIVLKYDGRMQEAPEGQRDELFEAAIAESGAEPGTIAYMAMQRAMRGLGITNAVELSLRRERVTQLAALWMEAFLFGTQFERSRG